MSAAPPEGMPSRQEWREFAQWGAIGVLSMWSTWTLLRLGWILLIVAIVWAAILATQTDPGRTGWGFVAGLGVVPLWIGILNRSSAGPLDPAWWLVSGGVTVAVSVVLFLRPRRRAPAGAQPDAQPDAQPGAQPEAQPDARPDVQPDTRSPDVGGDD